MRFHFAISIFLLFAVICYQVSSADSEISIIPAINKQINEELHASYVYHSLSNHFEDHNIAQHGFSKFFLKYAQKKGHSAEELSHFLIVRGFDIKYPEIAAVTNVWGTALESFNFALELEKSLNKGFYDLLLAAQANHDFHLSSFLAHFVTEQYDTIHELDGIITNLKSVGPGLGEYAVNKKLYKKEDD